MHSLRLDTEEIISSLEGAMQQPYVEKHIKKPFIDQYKLMWLTDIYQHADIRAEEIKQLIITVMLVQSALDTHELIPADNGPAMSETEKQLSVLAGDYYSGLYYKLLAEQGNISMILVLARSIKQINEFKMNLYYEEATDFNELIYFLMKMESLLITNVSKAYEMDETYIQVVEKTCLLNRLMKEATAAEANEHTYLTVFLQSPFVETSSIQPVQYIEREIEKQKIELDYLLSLLPSAYSDIQNVVKEKFSLSYHTTFAEEG